MSDFTFWMRNGYAGIVLVLAVVVADGLLLSVERPRERLDPRQPLHARHAEPARHDEPQRVPVLGRERRAVHRPGEQDLVRRRGFRLEAAPVVMLDPAIEAAVGAEKRDVGRVGR